MPAQALRTILVGRSDPVVLRRALGATTVWIAALFAATGPAAAGGPQTMGTSTSVVDRELDAIDFDGRSQPADAAIRIERFAAAFSSGDRRHLEALMLRGVLLAKALDIDGAKKVASEIDARANHFPGDQAQFASAAGSFVRGSADYFGGSLEEAERALSRAYANLPDSASSLVRVRFMAQLARAREQAGKFDEAVTLNLQAIQLADEAGPAWRRADLRSSLGYELFAAGQVDRAENAILEAIRIATSADDPLSLCNAMNSQGYVLGALGDKRGELTAMRLAVTSARKAGARREESQSLANLADLYLRQGYFAQALSVSREALALSRTLKNITGETTALGNVGFSLIELRQRTEGNGAVEAALVLAKRSDSSKTILDMYEEWGGHLEHIGAFKEAHAAYARYRQLDNDVAHSEQQKVILEQQEQFDSQKRAGALQLLEREHRLRDGELFHHSLSVKLWATAAVLAVVALVGFGQLYRRLKRLNTGLEAANAQLKSYGERDPLTGLANRRYFAEAMNRMNASAMPRGILILIDIDHFKRINDNHGHAAGDEALVEVSRRIQSSLRERDILVRWGGEEFLVFAEDLDPKSRRAESLIERLLQSIGSTEVFLSTGALRMTASLGYATFPLDGTAALEVPWAQAVDVVDKLMYVAKQGGRNCAYGIRSCQAATLLELEIATESWTRSSREGKAVLEMQLGPGAAVEHAA